MDRYSAVNNMTVPYGASTGQQVRSFPQYRGGRRWTREDWLEVHISLYCPRTRDTRVDMRLSVRALPLFIAMLATGCTSTPPACPPGTQSIVLESLYFGTAKPEGIVTDQEWETFLDDTVGVEFPEGLTSWTTYGRWRNPSGSVVAETSHVLQLVHDGSQERERGLQRIVHAYKSRFQQEAVMRIRSLACRSL